MKWLVIGYGSSLHCDDNLGRIVAEKLRTKNEAFDLEILTGNQLYPEWSEPISRARGVIFVDATTLLPAGKFKWREIASDSDVSLSPNEGCFSHHCGPESLVNAAKTLYGYAPRSWLYIVGGEDFSLGERISDSVSVTIDKVVNEIQERIGAESKVLS
ncbi:hypothetical protein BH10CYA1_BH10CYA1_60560 [soil metagenome]